MTTSPQDLVAAVARAVADGASADERRIGRQACIVLAQALGEPGTPMTPMTPGASAPAGPVGTRIDGAQLLEVATVKLRAFLGELEAKNAAASSPSSTATQRTTEPAPAPAASSSVDASVSPSSSPSSRTPRPPLRIPLVGGFGRSR